MIIWNCVYHNLQQRVSNKKLCSTSNAWMLSCLAQWTPFCRLDGDIILNRLVCSLLGHINYTLFYGKLICFQKSLALYINIKQISIQNQLENHCTSKTKHKITDERWPLLFYILIEIFYLFWYFRLYETNF